MSVKLRCPNCPVDLKAPAHAAGQFDRCPKCKWSLRVPDRVPNAGAPPAYRTCEKCGRTKRLCDCPEVPKAPQWAGVPGGLSMLKGGFRGVAKPLYPKGPNPRLALC
jgi:hypothetical protein